MFRFPKKDKTENTIPVELAPRGVHHTISFAISKDDTFAHIRKELKKMGQTAQKHTDPVSA